MLECHPRQPLTREGVAEPRTLAQCEVVVKSLATASIFLTFVGFAMLPATWGYSAFALVAGVVLAIICVIVRVGEWWGWAAVGIATVFVVGFVFWSGTL